MTNPLIATIKQDRARALKAGDSSALGVQYRSRLPGYVDALVSQADRVLDEHEYPEVLDAIEAAGITNYSVRHDAERDPERPYTVTTLRWSGEAWYGATRLDALRELLAYALEHRA